MEEFLSKNENEELVERPNLGRYQQHRKRFPWRLLMMCITAAALIAMLWYFTAVLKEKNTPKEESEGYEIEVSLD